MSTLKSATLLEDLKLLHYAADPKLVALINKSPGLCLLAELKKAILVSDSLYLNSILSITHYEKDGSAEILEENDKSFFLSTLKLAMYHNQKINYYLHILKIVSGLIAICQALKNEGLLPNISSFASPIEEKELVPPIFFQDHMGNLKKTLYEKLSPEEKERSRREDQIFGG